MTVRLCMFGEFFFQLAFIFIPLQNRFKFNVFPSARSIVIWNCDFNLNIVLSMYTFTYDSVNNTVYSLYQYTWILIYFFGFYLFNQIDFWRVQCPSHVVFFFKYHSCTQFNCASMKRRKKKLKWNWLEVLDILVFLY